VNAGIATTTILRSSTNPSVFGQSVTFTAAVAPSSGCGSPTGSVTFYAGSTALGTAPLRGKKASLKTTLVPVGSQGITAVYSGDTTYAPSTSAVLTQTVNQDATKTRLTSSAKPSVYGQSVTFTATVTAASPGSGTPTGSVEFYDGSTDLGPGTFDGTGTATFATSTLSVGAHSITGVYSGDTNFTTSTSAVVNQRVNQARTTTTLASSVNPSTFGQAVTFTATISVSSPGSGTPTGTVTFYDGSNSLGTGSVSGGIATFATSSLSVRTHSIKAVYGGDSNFKTSTSAAANLTVDPAPTLFTTLASPTIDACDGSTSLWGEIAAGSLIPTGSVAITINGVTERATIHPVTGDFSASFPTAALGTAGSPYAITYAYAGNADFAATHGTGNLTVATLPLGVEGQTTYHSILGDVLTMNIWQGTHVSLLTPTSMTGLDPTVMAKILATVDNAYEYYASATGAQPNPYPPDYYINGRDTIAVVDHTGGAGYSYLGSTGIEVMTPYFNTLYNGVVNNNQYDQVVFYELGRNFWLYGNQLNGTSIGQNSFTTGFAVMMRFLSLDSTGQAGGPFNGWTYAEFEQNVKNLVDKYVADPSLNFNNTLAIGQGVPNSQLGSTDLFASFLFRLGRDYGGNAFYQSLWKEVGVEPAATTDQGAIDNLFLAACYAADRNLTNLFIDTWRWPISTAAQAQAAKLPAPVVNSITIKVFDASGRDVSGGVVNPGTKIYARATITSNIPVDPTATITYKLYDSSGQLIRTQTVLVGQAPDAFPLPPGVYAFSATFNGDAQHDPFSSAGGVTFAVVPPGKQCRGGRVYASSKLFAASTLAR